MNTAEALGKLGVKDDRVINTLIELLKDSSSNMRLNAAEALVMLGVKDDRVSNALFELLKDSSSNMRSNAAKALGTLYQSHSDTELLQLLTHRQSGYRIAAANALAQRQHITQEVKNQIAKYKVDDRPWVRLAAWDAALLIEEKMKADKETGNDNTGK